MHQQDCRGIDAPGFGPAACRPLGTLDPATYQEKGYNTAAANTPVYYTATRGLAEVVQAVTPADDLVTAGRLDGRALARARTRTDLRHRPPARRAGGPMAAVTLLLAATPALHLPERDHHPRRLGAGRRGRAVLALTWWEERPAPAAAALLVPVAVVVAFAKMTNLVGVAAVALYLLLRPAGDDGRGGRRPACARGGDRPARWASPRSSPPAPGWRTWDAPPDPRRRPARHGHPVPAPYFPWTGLVDSSLSLLQPLSSLVGRGGVRPTRAQLRDGRRLAAPAGRNAGGGAVHRRPCPRGRPGPRRRGRRGRRSAPPRDGGLPLLEHVLPDPARYGIALVAPMAIVTASMIRSRSSVVLVGSTALLALAATTFRLAALL